MKLNLAAYSNAIDDYWMIHLAENSNPEDLEMIRSILPIKDIPETWGLTLLHQTVLKRNGLNLRDVLETLPKKEIDARDHLGRTALWWAATRNDVPTLSMLVQHGANVNIGSKSGKRPLDIALFYSPACARVLLIANADVITPNGDDWPTLVTAAYYGTSIDIVEQILLRNTEINAVTKTGETALYAAAQQGHKLIC